MPSPATRLYDPLAPLPLRIDGYVLDGLRRAVSSGFERHTTVVRLRGGGHEGLGEDVTYDAGDQRALQREGRSLPLAGAYTLDEFSRRLDEIELFPRPPQHPEARDYRRWAFESAALDLALCQNGLSLAAALGLAPGPVRFVVSVRLGQPPALGPVERLRARHPRMRFKLDATDGWTPELIRALAATAAVDVVDFKGAYRGTPVDQAANAELYRRVAEAFPSAWLEDPALTPETVAALSAYRERISWDAPIHGVADVERLRWPPRTLNIKPSRAGSLARLLELYEHCRDGGIAMYGGGQFELGPGRGQIQYLAALFHADAPNDVAPRGYNETRLPAGLPGSPLEPGPAPIGFRRVDDRSEG